MCTLNVEMHCDLTGIKIKCVTTGLYPIGSYESDYYYTWDVVNHSDADKLLPVIPQISEVPKHLQCVSHVSPGTRNHTY